MIQLIVHPKESFSMKSESIGKMSKVRLINDHFQNYKTYGIPKAQLVIADIPYNIGKNACGSRLSFLDEDRAI